MALIFKDRYGFFDGDQKFIGYIYEEVDSGRRFSAAQKVNSNMFYINELDETFGPNDNTYSILTAGSLDEAKGIIEDILEGRK